MKHKHVGKDKKAKAYGSKRTREWCAGCDAQLVIPEPVKRRARQAAKKEIKSEMLRGADEPTPLNNTGFGWEW